MQVSLRLLKALIKEAMQPKSKFVPLGKRAPIEQATYYVKSARSWLKAGAPILAAEELNNALAIRDGSVASIRPLLLKAKQLAYGPSPRAADYVVDDILAMLLA